MISIPRIVISAPHSGCGKTTISTGLMAALSKSKSVQAFKVGPDYIDPGYHMRATGRPSRNLDSWMLSHNAVLQTAERGQEDADIAIIEGVMGLYDGYDALTERGSTAELAKLLGAPVIIVLDVSKMARTAGAVALGLRDFDPVLQVAGVICNRVGSDTHARWVTEAVEAMGLPVIGCIPRLDALHLPERHLGLHMAHERSDKINAFLDASARAMETYLDLDRLMEIATSAAATAIPQAVDNSAPAATQRVRIAVAQDAAFCFYYQDNFDLLEAAGAELVFFSPLQDETLPDGVDGLYLGGGYPELYAHKLAANYSMMQSLAHAIHSGLPTYAECGGLMVLTQRIVTIDGQSHTMLGILPGFAKMRDRVRIGYREINAHVDTLLLQRGETTRGHEFHYSDWLERGANIPVAYAITPRNDASVTFEGYAEHNLLASYVHIHFAAYPELAWRFVGRCSDYREQSSELPAKKISDG